jgi:hypothetical protein
VECRPDAAGGVIDRIGATATRYMLAIFRPECLLYQTASVGTLRGLRRMDTICGTAM